MTEYTVSAEASVPVALTGAELIGITQAGKYYMAQVKDVMAAAVTLSGVTLDAPIVMSGLATQSILITTTKSGRLGFYGAAGTSQRSGGVQATVTATALSVSGVVGFTSTAQFSNAIGLINEMRQVLVDAGLMAGA